MKKLLFYASLLTLLTACSAEVGSKEWCQELKQKSKGDWSANEAKEFAKNCLFK